MAKLPDILVIPDTQCKAGGSVAHIRKARNYIVEHRPAVIVQIGDWYDMESSSVYSTGLAAEGRRIIKDVNAGNLALDALMHKWPKGYKPKLVWTMGNHEERLSRYVNNHPEMRGLVTLEMFDFYRRGWSVHTFLKVVEIHGVTFSHFFPRSGNGRVMQNKRGAPSAKTQLDREGRSCVAGHCQGFDYANKPVGGRLTHSVIAGSFYDHDEEYLSPQGNDYWRGLVHLHDVRAGNFELELCSIDYLNRHY